MKVIFYHSAQILGFLWFLLTGAVNKAIVAAQNSDVSQQDAFTLDSLDPGLIEDAVEDMRGIIEDNVLNALKEAYEETGINERLEWAIDSAEDIAEDIAGVLDKFRAAFAETEKAEDFLTYADNLIDKELDKVFGDLAGVCSGTTSTRFLNENEYAASVPQKSFMQSLGNIGMSDCDQGKDIEGDYGALCITVGASFGYKFQKGDLYLQADLGIGVDSGYAITEDSAYFRSVVAAGVSVEIGKDASSLSVCANSDEYRDGDICKKRPQGYLCYKYKVFGLCPKDQWCPQGSVLQPAATPGPTPTRGLRVRVLADADAVGPFTCATGACPNPGSYNDEGKYVCEIGYDAPLPELCPCPASKFRDSDGVCTVCPDGHICSNNKVSDLCPKGKYCMVGITLDCVVGNKKKANAKCPKPGAFDATGVSVCDTAEKTDLCGADSNFQKGYGLGLTYYLPGNSGDMDGSGSWDVTVSMGGISYFKGKLGMNGMCFLKHDTRLS
jgi:hypothetical protein